MRLCGFVSVDGVSFANAGASSSVVVVCWTTDHALTTVLCVCFSLFWWQGLGCALSERYPRRLVCRALYGQSVQYRRRRQGTTRSIISGRLMTSSVWPHANSTRCHAVIAFLLLKVCVTRHASRDRVEYCTYSSYSFSTVLKSVSREELVDLATKLVAFGTIDGRY